MTGAYSPLSVGKGKGRSRMTGKSRGTQAPRPGVPLLPHDLRGLVTSTLDREGNEVRFPQSSSEEQHESVDECVGLSRILPASHGNLIMWCWLV